MKLPRRNFLHLAAGAATLPALSRIARAQVYPSRPITMLVGYGVGGPSDTIARIVADRMRSTLGQPIVVENVTGAAGSNRRRPPRARGARRLHDSGWATGRRFASTLQCTICHMTW